MNKPLALAVILLFLSVSVIPSTGTTDVKQSTLPTISGNTLYVGGNGTGNYTKIQDAINDSSNGDTVYVYDDSSPYYENVVIGYTKSITLVGEDRNTTVIDGSNNGNVVRITAYGVVINGFTIQNSGTEIWNDSGILVYDYESRNSIISNNIIKSNVHGILLLCTNNCNIIDNLIASNNHGIVISGLRMYYSCFDNIISRNIISNNTVYGILCGSESSKNTFTNNIIIFNRYGIGINTGSYFNIFEGNNISKNSVGIKSSPMGTIITKNNFIKNIRHAKQYYFSLSGFTDHGTPDCVFDGNYWGRARIFPYPIPTRHGILPCCIFLGLPLWDMHPAQEPYDIGV